MKNSQKLLIKEDLTCHIQYYDKRTLENAALGNIFLKTKISRGLILTFIAIKPGRGATKAGAKRTLV